jgi:uncharacterized protein
MVRGWRALGLFWLGIVVLTAIGAAWLALLGPLPAPAVAGAVPPIAAAPPAAPVAVAARPTPPVPPAAAPLLQPHLPSGPLVALVISGVGLDEVLTEQLQAMPEAVTLAVSPYGSNPIALAEALQKSGRSYLVSLPLEPAGYPMNDAGPRVLLTGADPAQNDLNLSWALKRVPGAVGATGALGDLRGERYAANPALFGPLLLTLRQRGLFYLDPRPGAALPNNAAARAVNVIVDDPPDAASIEARLAELEHLAQDHGSAIGLAGPPRPVLVERLQGWVGTLAQRGLTLVPLASLMPPVDTLPPQDKPETR